METPCWSPSEGLQHGDRKPVETSGVYFGPLKTFILTVKLENIRIGKHRHINIIKNQHTDYSELENIRRIDIFVHVTCYPETMLCSVFKAVELKTGQQIFG